MVESPEKLLVAELEADIAHHRKWESRDFGVAQMLLWGGIAASIAASIHAAGAFTIPKGWAALMAAVPGAVLVIDKTFKFAKRASWHALYRASLSGLRGRLIFQGHAARDVAEERSKLDIDMENKFPPPDAGSDTPTRKLQPPESGPDRPPKV